MTHEKELIELLDKETTARECNAGDLPVQREIIERTFREFGLQGKITRAYCGPQVNCFDFEIGTGEKLQSYRQIEKNLQMALKATNVRMVLPGSEVGIECRLEVPAKCRMTVSAGTVFRSFEWCESKARLPLMLGKGIDGTIEIIDLARAMNLLMAGSTGSGKSVFMDSCIQSLMFKHTPDELKLILVDPKVVEFNKYLNLPYLQFPVIHDVEATLDVLQWLVTETERRYELLVNAACRDIQTWNQQHPDSLPYIIMFIDELADFMLEARSQMETLLSEICAKSRAVGIYLIIATQRPDSKVLTGIIKCNFPTRIAFDMASRIDSRLFIGSDDAAFLVGSGDMLFHGPCGEALTRIQGSYVKPEESARIAERLQAIYKDVISKRQLPKRHALFRNHGMILRNKLVEIIQEIVDDRLDYAKNDIVDDITDGIADAIMEHWNELKDVVFDEEEE